MGAAQEFHKERKKQKLTQAIVAKRLGLRQPQISDFENGKSSLPDLSEAKLELLPATLRELLRKASTEEPPEPSSLRFCSSQTCPLHLVMTEGEGTKGVFLPTFTRVGTYCRACGEPMAHRCENRECRALARHGIYCIDCGEPYVEPRENPPDDWVERRERVRQQLVRDTEPESPLKTR